MKTIIFITLMYACIIQPAISQENISGAWHQKKGSSEIVLILQPNYFTITEFDTTNKKFNQSWGGNYTRNKNAVSASIEFHSADKTAVGKKINFEMAKQNELLVSNILPGIENWKIIDNNQSVLAGLWVITAREQNGNMNEIIPCERKTIKILTGTRFQWAAINTATGDFFGTGGGTFTLQNGVYTERIEFFSRDGTRVGSSLGFNAIINGNKWEHSGKSSKGDPVHEIWTRLP